jgi:two-component system, OmpR family, response regulator RegX3
VLRRVIVTRCARCALRRRRSAVDGDRRRVCRRRQIACVALERCLEAIELLHTERDRWIRARRGPCGLAEDYGAPDSQNPGDECCSEQYDDDEQVLAGQRNLLDSNAPTVGARRLAAGVREVNHRQAGVAIRFSTDADRGLSCDDPIVRILVVEDEDAIAEPLAEGLRREGFDVDRVATGQGALDASAADLVLLDLRLPDVDGTDVCRELRGRSDVPIIIVTARGEEVERVVGLELGADDYVVKPFGFRELLARIRAVQRRARPATRADLHRVGQLEIDVRARRASVDRRELRLTTKEFDLLALLASDPGAVIGRERILREVWKSEWYGPTKTVDVHVASLRRKLGDGRWIETVRGVGLRLAPQS